MELIRKKMNALNVLTALTLSLGFPVASFAVTEKKAPEVRRGAPGTNPGEVKADLTKTGPVGRTPAPGTRRGNINFAEDSKSEKKAVTTGTRPAQEEKRDTRATEAGRNRARTETTDQAAKTDVTRSGKVSKSTLSETLAQFPELNKFMGSNEATANSSKVLPIEISNGVPKLGTAKSESLSRGQFNAKLQEAEAAAGTPMTSDALAWLNSVAGSFLAEKTTQLQTGEGQGFGQISPQMRQFMFRLLKIRLASNAGLSADRAVEIYKQLSNNGSPAGKEVDSRMALLGIMDRAIDIMKTDKVDVDTAMKKAIKDFLTAKYSKDAATDELVEKVYQDCLKMGA